MPRKIESWNGFLFEQELATHKKAFKESPDVQEKLDKIGNVDVLGKTVFSLYQWFAGGYMGNQEFAKTSNETIQLLRKVSEAYHKPVGLRWYRAVHMRVTEMESDKEIMERNLGSVSNKLLQSWSRDKEGAEYFFKHFVSEQNGSDRLDPKKAWVILSTDGTDLEQLLTFEECMQFCFDAAASIDTEKVRKWVKHIYADDMIQLHELICEAKTEKIPFKVEKILVKPGKMSPAEENARGYEDLEKMLRRIGIGH